MTFTRMDPLSACSFQPQIIYPTSLCPPLRPGKQAPPGNETPMASIYIPLLDPHLMPWVCAGSSYPRLAAMTARDQSWSVLVVQLSDQLLLRDYFIRTRQSTKFNRTKEIIFRLHICRQRFHKPRPAGRYYTPNQLIRPIPFPLSREMI